MGDPAVAQRVEVFEDPGHGAGIVGPDRGVRAAARPADQYGGQRQLFEQRRARVPRARVDDEDPVHAAFGPPAPVDRAFGVDVLHHLEEQGDPAGREHLLYAGDELEEEGLDAEGVRGPGEDEADRAGAFAGQGAGGAVGLPAEFLGDPADAGAGVRGDARAVVEREGDGALRHSGLPGDVLDGGSAGHACLIPR